MKTPTLRTSTISAKRSHNRFAYVLLLPALILFFVAFVVPIVYSIVLSVFSRRSDGGGAFAPKQDVFVWFENYAGVLADPTFWAGLQRLGIYSLFMVPILVILSIALALLLDLPKVKLRAFSRMAIFLPYGVPSVIAALMWGFLYVPAISPIYQIGEAFGLDFPPLLRGDLIYTAIINVVLWGGIGFNTIIVYTALQSLPKELIDAARIDGCNEFTIARYVKLPHIVPATILTGLFSVIGALQVYSEPQMLSTLTTAINSTFFPLMRVYRDAFAHDDLNSAATASIILAVATVLLSLLVVGIRTLITRRSSHAIQD